MNTEFKDSYGVPIKTTDRIRFIDERGKLIESGIYATYIGLSVKRDLGFYSSLKSIVDTFQTQVIK
ncbi:hypothetical protein ACR77J_07420 [Tissierella praeacuta]|uniref:hypothetical protein n=1 Tax=Tissierella praeacuta TaxID=43131 RepID=UPI003DA359A8